MRSRRWPIVIGALLVAAAALLALWPVMNAGWLAMVRAGAVPTQEAPRLHIRSSTPQPLELALRFERPNGAVGHLTFVRESADAPWQPDPRVGTPGVLLGDGYPVFASPRFLAVHGLDARTALRSLTLDIAREQADDVTAIQSWGGEVAIGLWNHGKITRVYAAGPIFDAIHAIEAEARDATDGGASGGASALDACARLEALMAPTRPAPVRIAACAAAIAGCPSLRESAIERLRDACEQGEPVACEVLVARDGTTAQLWPEIDDCWRWVLDLLDAAPPMRQAR